MKSTREQAIKYYDNHAATLRARYQDIGCRQGDVLLGFSLIHNPPYARVLEIGCGYGREAAEILRHTQFYTGIDASREFIKLAREYVPEGRFIEADAVEYDYPGRYDLVFSFATLRHLDQKDMQTVLRRVLRSLRPGGVLYISLNYGRRYMEQVIEDDLGSRHQYLYNPGVIERLAGPDLEIIYQTRDMVGHCEWFDMALQKPR